MKTEKELFDFIRSNQKDGKLSQAEVNATNKLLQFMTPDELLNYLADLNDWHINDVQEMRLSKAGAGLIKQFEEFVAKPYLDAVKVPTIGYGSTYYPDGRKVSLKDAPITEQRASEMMEFIANKDFGSVINVLLAKQIKEGKITQNMFDALVSLAYNIGAQAITKSSVIRLLRAGDKVGAAKAITMWNRAGGKILTGLSRRREKEKALFLA